MSRSLTELGWNDELQANAEILADSLPADFEIARVMADFGKDLRVVGAFGDERAALAGKLRFEPGARPAVGDFVALVGAPGSWIIVETVPRRTHLARQAAGEKTARQMIGANLDLVFVVTSFNEDLNINRIERYLVAIREGGATPIVVVNKSDLVDPSERDRLVDELRERLGTDVFAVSAHDPATLGPIDEQIGPGITASFVGSSGVGKSSILNAVCGEEAQRVQETRNDDKGRHTTTHRELFVLEGGGLLLDTPGMREFQLWDEAVDEAFEDIDELSDECRFRDCAHESEPGCAVLEAVEVGALSPERLESWRKLRREAEHQQRRQDAAAGRDHGRQFEKVVREAKRIKGRDD